MRIVVCRFYCIALSFPDSISCDKMIYFFLYIQVILTNQRVSALALSTVTAIFLMVDIKVVLVGDCDITNVIKVTRKW